VGNDKRHTPDGTKLAVEEGDTIFLHRTREAQPRSGYLLGPFVAESDAQQNIVPYAWNHLGDFSWQVEIGWEEPVYSFNVEKYYEDNDDPSLDLTAYAQHFSEVQGLFLTGKVKDGDIIINA
jgi:hypothetical protein